MMKKRYYILFLLFPMLALVGCTDEELFHGSDESVTLSYSVSLDDEAKSRAIGDGSHVNQLLVGIFQDGVQLHQKDFEVKNNRANITLDLLKNQTYQLVFWAQAKGNGIYNTNDLSQITIDYDNFSKTQAEAAALDAFYATRTVSLESPGETTVTLTRPFTQFGIGIYGNEVEKEKIVSAEIKIIGTLYTAFSPLAEGEKAVAGEASDYTFTFTELNDKTETFTINGKDYTLLTTNYFLVPTAQSGTKVSGHVSLKDADGTSVSEFDFTDAPLVLNTRVNIGKGLTEVWDGVIVEQLPEADDDGIIHIENTQQLAYFIKYGVQGTPEDIVKVQLDKDLDMNATSIVRDVNYAMSHVSFDGSGNTLYHLGNALFGNATNITVQNLNIESASVSETGHVGVLVNALTGSSTFTGISISNSSATTTDGAAGGMIGYITKKESETLQATISACTATDNIVDGSLASGIYVGRFRGYDNNETLTFSSDNQESSATTTTGKTPYYVADHAACWLVGKDYSKYSGWLGDEEYYRGTINYGDNRFIPKWDGTTKVEPLKDGSTQLIYSAFDVASLQKASPSAVTFKEDVDLGSHKFNPIRSITTLDGTNHTVYNLKVDMVHDGYGAAFIQSVSGTTTHKDLTFVGADIKNVHDASIPAPAYGVTDDGGAGNAYAGTLLSHSGGTYNVSNVHVKDSKVYAVCKMGGLVGYVGGNLNMNGCSVDNCTIENYAPGVPNYYTLPGVGYMDIYLQQFQDNAITNGLLAAIGIHKIPEYGRVNLLQWWYTQGEAGGLIGFVKSPKAVIDNCSVTNTVMKCTGQPNKSVVANVWDKNDFDTSNPFQSGKKIFAKGTTDIAGRHVNQFIGDVVSARSSEEGTDYDVTISNYSVSGNKYFDVNASNTNDYNHNYQSGKYCEVVGCAYYVGVDVGVGSITLKHVNDYAGSLTFYSEMGGETSKVTLTETKGQGNNMTWMGGSFSDPEFKQNRDKIGGTWLRPTYGPWYYTTESEYPTYP